MNCEYYLKKDKNHQNLTITIKTCTIRRNNDQSIEQLNGNILIRLNILIILPSKQNLLTA